MPNDLAPGISFELMVTRLQRMLDPHAIVSHNEWLTDRVGNRRQFDIVIRGNFAGRQMLGVIECKDHNRRKGPDTIDAFAKKTENLRTNLRIIVSRHGFTEQALKLAKHEGIACLSLLPDDDRKTNFSVGDLWYGVIKMWDDMRLTLHFPSVDSPVISGFDSASVMWDDKPVVNWFLKKLFTEWSKDAEEGPNTFSLMFDEVRKLQVSGTCYDVTGVSVHANWRHAKKKKWVSWNGDGIYDWHTGSFTVPAGGRIVGSGVETDLNLWDDFEGDIPWIDGPADSEVMNITVLNTQRWDEAQDDQVPDLEAL